MEIENLIALRRMTNGSSSNEDDAILLDSDGESLSSEDEDVILPNSPLDQYLQGLGPSETSTFPNDFSTSKKNYRLSVMKYMRINAFTYVFSVKALFVQIAKICVNYLLCTLFVTYFIKKGAKRVRKTFSAIEQSKLLIEEDVVFLQTFRTEHSNLPRIITFGFDLLFHFLFFSYCALFVDFKDFKQLFNVSCLLLTTWMLASLLGLLLWLYFYRFSKHIHYLADDMSSVFLFFQKSIRLIQEAELIARGFTAVSVTSAVERIELSKSLPINSSSRQYIQLRKCVFSSMKNLFLSSKLQTNAIVHTMNLDKLYEFPSTLASLNIEEFGGLLNYDLESPELLRITVNFSISTLKTMYELLKMQVSEFLKYTITAMLLKHEEEPDNFRVLLSYAYHMNSSVKHLLRMTKSTSKNVKDTYCFYKSIEASYVGNALKQPREPKTANSALEVSVHNMSLHLKTSLLRLLEIEEHLAAGEREQIPDSVGSLLKVVDSEILAFNECFVLSSKIFNDSVNPKAETVDVVMPANQRDKNEDSSVCSIIPKCDIQREIYDEVFEDVIEEMAIAEDHYKSFQSEKSKRNSEVSSHLMKELKNVLVVKADEHRTREKIALAKMSKGHINPVENASIGKETSEDNTVPVGEASREAETPKCRLVENANDMDPMSKDGIQMPKDRTDPNGNACAKTEMSKSICMDPVRNSSTDEGVYQNAVGVIESDNLDNGNLTGTYFMDAGKNHRFVVRDTTEGMGRNSLNSSHAPMSFSASIASLAARRQELLGFVSEEVFGSASDDDSD